MGGAVLGLLRPVGNDRRISSYNAHWNRTTPSTESGVDYYCPIGTPVLAAGDGVVVDVGGGVGPATGRYVTIDLDNGMRVRYLHLSYQSVRVGQRVTRGQVIGLSGASGYGSEYFGASSLATIPSYTGGPHVHTTLWPYHRYTFGSGKKSGTVDFELYADNAMTASTSGEDDMYNDDAQKALFAKIESETRPYKTYQYGSGLILMGDGGKTWAIPSPAYQTLLIAQGLTSATVQRVIDANELGFLKMIRGMLSPDPRDAQVQAVLDLSEEDAARIAAAIPAPVLTLTPAQLDEIAKAASAGAAEGGAAGAKAAIQGLSFVVKAG